MFYSYSVATPVVTDNTRGIYFSLVLSSCKAAKEIDFKTVLKCISLIFKKVNCMDQAVFLFLVESVFITIFNIEIPE